METMQEEKGGEARAGESIHGTQDESPTTHRSRLKHLSAKGGVILAAKVVHIILRFCSLSITTRALGPAYRGVYSMILQVPDILASIGDYGFGPAAFYYSLKEKHDMRRVMGATILYSTGASIILMSVGFALANYKGFYRDEAVVLDSYIGIMLFCIPLLLLDSLTQRLLVALSKTNVAAGLQVIRSFTILASFLLMWVSGLSALRAAVLSIVFSYTFMVILPFAVILPHHKAYPPIFDLAFLWKMLRYGASGFFAQFSEIIILRIGLIATAATHSPEQVGYFSVALRMGELLMLLPTSMFIPLIPVLFKMKEGESGRFIPLLVKIVAAGMFVICSVVALGGGKMITIFFGDAFSDSFDILLYLLPGILAMSVTQFLRLDLFSRRKTGIVSAQSGVGFAVAVSLTFLLIPMMGVRGAAIAQSTSHAVNSILIMILYCRVSDNKLRHFFTPSMIERQTIRAWLGNQRKPQTVDEAN